MRVTCLGLPMRGICDEVRGHRQIHQPRPTDVLEISPADAARLDVEEGDPDSRKIDLGAKSFVALQLLSPG